LLAKEPVPGRVKTRLCPPWTPAEAAELAAAALHDTIDTVTATPAARRVLVLDGAQPRPAGWAVVPQFGADLPDRLAWAFTDTALPGTASLLIGMDTPQLTTHTLRAAIRRLATVDAVFGPAADGGWWALGLRHPGHAEALRGVPTSRADTGVRTLAALRARGLHIALLPELTDVDTARDAYDVAELCPTGSRFAAAVARSAVA
jgi:rSAM/selenodomain-associated transferase 1